MKIITLVAGTDHVKFSEMAYMIADAIWPDTGADDERWGYVGARINLEVELKQAVKTGVLPVKDPLTLGQHTFPIGNMLLSALVAVPDLAAYVADRGIAVEIEAPRKEAATLAKKETVEQRRARYLDWFSEEERISKRGALQRVFEREAKLNPKADRANIGKDIKQAQVVAKSQKQSGAFFGQLVTVKDGKRQN